VLTLTDQFLRGRGAFDPSAPAAGRAATLLGMTLLFSAFYGALMGSFGLCASGEGRLAAYCGIVAVKTPMLLLVTFILCLPSFFVLNAVAGLRDDFAEALRAVLGSIACLAIVLAAFGPVTLFFYLCTGYYDAAILLNGAVFAIAAVASLKVSRRYYGPLIRRSPRHRTLMRVWFGVYIFVAIQMAWTLRPFIGDPNPETPVVFLRSTQFDNAYVEVVRIIGQAWRMARGDVPAP
jgi:hypothetical protein